MIITQVKFYKNSAQYKWAEKETTKNSDLLNVETKPMTFFYPIQSKAKKFKKKRKWWMEQKNEKVFKLFLVRRLRNPQRQ